MRISIAPYLPIILNQEENSLAFENLSLLDLPQYVTLYVNRDWNEILLDSNSPHSCFQSVSFAHSCKKSPRLRLKPRYESCLLFRYNLFRAFGCRYREGVGCSIDIYFRMIVDNFSYFCDGELYTWNTRMSQCE